MSSVSPEYLKSLRSLCPNLSENEINHFASQVTQVKLKKKDYFLTAGKTQKSIGFITKGLIRAFYIDDAGTERTVGFYAEGEYATHFSSFVKQQASQYSLQCLEDTELNCLSLTSINFLYEKHPQFERYGRLIAEDILHKQQARIESFIFQTAEQRYLDFIQQYPSLFSRVSLSHLCSFLGIERQTLTRIRQNLAQR